MRMGMRAVRGMSGREGDGMSNDSLGTALPAEMARVRDEVLPAYLEIGQAGSFAVAMIQMHLDKAAAAMATGDVIAMLSAYQALKETTL